MDYVPTDGSGLCAHKAPSSDAIDASRLFLFPGAAMIVLGGAFHVLFLTIIIKRLFK